MTLLFTRRGSAAVALTAVVCGDVALASGTNIWFGAVLRGDVAPIVLGENVNIQDGTIVHCDFDVALTIEPGVVVGHAAVLHGVRIGADSLIGIGAKLLSGSIIGPECVVAAGAVVPPNMVVPPRSLVMGLPAKVVRSTTPEVVARTRTINLRYRELADRYLAGDVPGERPTRAGDHP
jgi:carbonic anhydrase/acetyltransferase-like protein (isoleucine patch superfamily)